MKFGIYILVFFATVWWIGGAWLSGNGSLLLTCIPFLISAAIVYLALRQSELERESPEEGSRIGRLVGIASSAEGILIGLAMAFMTTAQKIDFGPSVVAIVVGLHFIPLARWLPARLYYATGCLMVAIGTAGLLIPSVSNRITFIGVGCACVLWLTCVAVLRQLQHQGSSAEA